MNAAAEEYDSSFRTRFGASAQDIRNALRSANIAGKDYNAYTLNEPFMDVFERGSEKLLQDPSYLDALGR
jgi:hypothetical protein